MGRTLLLCGDCSTEIFVDQNMVMLKDDLWEQVSNGKEGEAYCDRCIEQRLGRPIEEADMKPDPDPCSKFHIPCNEFYLLHRSRNASSKG